MEKFTASNGVEVTMEKQAITGWRRLWFGRKDGVSIEISGRNLKALIECLDAERDADLGRWRWPENPNYMVYPRDDGHVAVLSEPEGVAAFCVTRAAARGAGEGNPFLVAARAYFEDHPERKPWEDAKPGEVWAVTLHGKERPCKVVEPTYSEHAVAFLPLNEPSPTWFVPSAAITEARRIWPEGD
ncbi:hypothetical protein [Microbacterium gilvum]|uniref:Uncharacterized protein n=1 Tax=Microbacterium gilvum TaxID=1336204 RepID=A0ABP9A5W6_9MICO